LVLFWFSTFKHKTLLFKLLSKVLLHGKIWSISTYPSSNSLSISIDCKEENYQITNPTIKRVFSQFRKVLNAVIRKHGSFDVMHIEMARELNNFYILATRYYFFHPLPNIQMVFDWFYFGFLLSSIKLYYLNTKFQ
jgi:hypothetical protein